jgi:hypothetical protein
VVADCRAATVKAGDLAHQRQAKAGAALVARDAGEGDEDAGAVGVRNPVAGVLDPERATFGVPDVTRTAAAVPLGVLEEVADEAAKNAVAPDQA